MNEMNKNSLIPSEYVNDLLGTKGGMECPAKRYIISTTFHLLLQKTMSELAVCTTLKGKGC